MDSQSILYDLNIIYSLIFVAVIVMYLPGGSIYAYSIMMMALTGILFIKFALMTKIQQQYTFLEMLKNIFFKSFPILLVLGIVTWLVYINIRWYDKIKQGKVPYEFLDFTNIVNLLLIFKIFILNSLIKKEFEIKDDFNSGNENLNKIVKLLREQSEMILYLLSIFGFLMVGFMQVIMDYFLTDG